MTDKEWEETLAEIQSLRFQLVNNIMPEKEREAIRYKLKMKLFRLSRRDQP